MPASLRQKLQPFTKSPFWRAVSWSLAALLLVLTLIPMPSGKIEPYWQFQISWDKFGHFGYIAALSLAIGLGWRMAFAKLSNAKTAWVVIGWGALAGALVELTQAFLPWRTGLDLDDFVADCLGAIFAWLIFPLVARILKSV